jgi:hypothetical protein
MATNKAIVLSFYSGKSETAMLYQAEEERSIKAMLGQMGARDSWIQRFPLTSIDALDRILDDIDCDIVQFTNYDFEEDFYLEDGVHDSGVIVPAVQIAK